MDQLYQAHGLHLAFPEGWELNEEQHAERMTITVSSPATSFWCLSLFEPGVQPDEVIDSVLETFGEVYDELDVYEAEASMGGLPTSARDLQFVCHELINSAFLRAFRTDQHTMLVLFQGTDDELEETRETLDAITASLAWSLGGGLGPPPE